MATMPPGSGVEQVAEHLRESLSSHGVKGILVERRVHLAVDEDDQRQLFDGEYDAAVFVVGPSTTILAVAYEAAAACEAAGMPALLLVPHTLGTQNVHEAALVALPIRSLEHPAGQAPDAAAVLERFTTPLSEAELRPDGGTDETPSPELEGTEDELRHQFESRGWTDGLPIVLPTPERVAEMLSGTSRAASDVVAEQLPPEGGAVTVQDVAVVAVMAGAAPVHLPVILASASLAADPSLEPMTRSVNSFAFAQLVSGPYAERAGMSGGLGALSPDSTGNAVVGRALSLLQRNCGRARIGASISPVQGNIAARGFAFTENIEESPWPALHEERGCRPSTSTVTLYSGGQAHLGNFYYDDLDTIAQAMTSVDLFSGALVLVSAKRAQELAAAGMSRQDVAHHLHNRATVSLGAFRSSGFYPLRSSSIARGATDAWPRNYLEDDDATLVPAFPPGSIKVAVVGGALSSLVQVWFMREHGTAVIDNWT